MTNPALSKITAPQGGNALLVTLISSAQGHTTHYFPVLIGAN